MVHPEKLEPPSDATQLVRLLRKRRSARAFAAHPLTKQALTDILWAAQGATPANRRTVPSAHALYTVCISVAVGRVENVDHGLYRYGAPDHSLTKITDEDFRPRLATACTADESWVNDSAAILVLSADFDQVKAEFADHWPYGQRGERYAWMEAGHVSQNVYLACAELGVGVTFVGGVDERLLVDAESSFRLPQNHELLGLLAVGMPCA